MRNLLDVEDLAKYLKLQKQTIYEYVIRYSQGARCVTMRVQANDALAAVDLAWQGWVEREF